MFSRVNFFLVDYTECLICSWRGTTDTFIRNSRSSHTRAEDEEEIYPKRCCYFWFDYKNMVQTSLIIARDLVQYISLTGASSFSRMRSWKLMTLLKNGCSLISAEPDLRHPRRVSGLGSSSCFTMSIALALM